MVSMNDSMQSAGDRMIGRRYEYDGRTVLAVDLGHVGDASVDVVDGTVIVVTGGEQFEFEHPAGGEVHAAVKNGVLTVEVEHGRGVTADADHEELGDGSTEVNA
jgi:hypothetical protein